MLCEPRDGNSKRKWVTAKGETKEAWVADWRDQNSKRYLKTLEQKKDAELFHATTRIKQNAEAAKIENANTVADVTAVRSGDTR